MATPNRNYHVPSPSDPAAVPADLDRALSAVDADMQTVMDETVEVRALAKEALAEAGSGGLPDGVVPIFETLAEAVAWEGENPGRVALTIEPPPDPGVWYATAPSFSVTDRSYVIPADAGATYSVNGSSQAAGTYTVGTGEETVSVSAVARPGYTLAGVASWSQEYPAWTPTPGTVLASDDFTGDGPLLGRTTTSSAGGVAFTWQDGTDTGSQGNDDFTTGGFLVAGDASRYAILPVAQADIEVAFRLVEAPTAGGSSISFRDHGNGRRYVLNWVAANSIRVQRFGPSGNIIVPGMSQTIGAPTVGTIIRVKIVGDTITVSGISNTGKAFELVGTDSDLPGAGMGVGVNLTAGMRIDDLVVTAR